MSMGYVSYQFGESNYTEILLKKPREPVEIFKVDFPYERVFINLTDFIEYKR